MHLLKLFLLIEISKNVFCSENKVYDKLRKLSRINLLFKNI